MISRESHLRTIESLFRRSPVVALLGAKQVGKTTLAREYAVRGSGPLTTALAASAGLG